MIDTPYQRWAARCLLRRDHHRLDRAAPEGVTGCPGVQPGRTHHSLAPVATKARGTFCWFTYSPASSLSWGGWPWRGGRDRPPPRARQAMIPGWPWWVFLGAVAMGSVGCGRSASRERWPGAVLVGLQAAAR